jgi:beta-lactamase class A
MENKKNTDLKNKLLNSCLELLNQRIDIARKAMQDAQEAANSEEKSTAGDKYDTSRAMSQNLRDMNAKQLQEALNDLAILQQINPVLLFNEVRQGSVVKTNSGNYFISVSSGKINIDNIPYFAVSASSPIVQVMLHKKSGESFTFRDQSNKIIEVF